jgi:hypothetical protein
VIDFLMKSRFALLIAFAFAVMDDPVSSVAYATRRPSARCMATSHSSSSRWQSSSA